MEDRFIILHLLRGQRPWFAEQRRRPVDGTESEAFDRVCTDMTHGLVEVVGDEHQVAVASTDGAGTRHSVEHLEKGRRASGAPR